MRTPHDVPILAGDTIDLTIDLDPQRAAHARATTAARAIRPALPTHATGRSPPMRLSALALAPRTACLMRIESGGAVLLDSSALNARLGARPLPPWLIDALALEVREAFVDEHARLHLWTPFDGVEAGGLLRAEALPPALAEAAVALVAGSVRRPLTDAEAREEHAARRGPSPSSARRVLLRGEALGVRVSPDAGAVRCGRLGPGRSPHAELEAAIDIPLASTVARSAAAETARDATFVVVNDVEAAVYDLGVLGALLGTPAARGALARWCEAHDARSGQDAPGDVDAARRTLAALAVAAFERPVPVTPGCYPRPLYAADEAGRGPAETGTRPAAARRRPGAAPVPLAAPCAPAPPLRLGLFVACRTAAGALCELALLPFAYGLDGQVVQAPVPEALTARAPAFDERAAEALLARAHWVVAHGAGAVRPVLERALPAARAARWACLRREAPWREHGVADPTLARLAAACGAGGPERHGALGDASSGVALLARRLPGGADSVLAALLARAAQETLRLWTPEAPPEASALLRARGYRPVAGDARDRAGTWWVDVAPEHRGTECEWLREEIYRPFEDPRFRDVGPLIPDPLTFRRISARTRWRADPNDCD